MSTQCDFFDTDQTNPWQRELENMRSWVGLSYE